jgi:hypothetical protein
MHSLRTRNSAVTDSTAGIATAGGWKVVKEPTLNGIMRFFAGAGLEEKKKKRYVDAGSWGRTSGAGLCRFAYLNFQEPSYHC